MQFLCSVFLLRVVSHWDATISRLAGSVCCSLEQETFTHQKVLVIPRNRWLRLNMTEKLFTGTLNHNQNKNKQNFATDWRQRSAI